MKPKMEPRKISREDFEGMYRRMTVKEMSKTLGVSATTIYKVIKDMGISKKGKREVWRKLIVED